VSERVERRLAAILAADVAGYSRLMGGDEEGTLSHLKALRATLVDPAIATHRGRIVKTTGDGLLVEFASVVDAARCAIEAQRDMAERSADVPMGSRIEFRIGIHVGDIIIDDGDIFGDGVNIAARLEGIAEPGGVCVSDDAYRQIRGKVGITFDDMGSRTLKNIAEPMRAWRLRIEANSSELVTPRTETAQRLALPDKPSIAVLPFQNMSGDPEQDYFADGMVEDIITALSQVKWFFVIARNSSFIYKGPAVDVKHVARDLGVRYVLEGSVRKVGGRVRITGQLIQAETGQHIWADRFDGELADVFDLQDQVTSSVVAAIEPSLRRAEIDRARCKPTERLDAYDWYLRALPHFYALGRESLDKAIMFLDRAIAIDPHFALAKALEARCYAWRNPQGWATAPEEERGVAVRLSREALQDGADDPSVLWMVGFAMWQLRVDPKGALELYDRSLALNANCAQALALRGWALATAGQLDEAVPSLLRALRLSPFDPEAFFTMSALGCAYLMAGRFDEAFKWTSRALRQRPTFAPALRFHAVCLVELGRLSEARDTVAHLLRLEPCLTISTIRRRAPIFDAKLMNTFLDGLRKAGLPERRTSRRHVALGTLPVLALN
jgi:TolB-like protein/class 3 adenylate cyclase/tetratricopeptide (TPR) repeat protein